MGPGHIMIAANDRRVTLEGREQVMSRRKYHDACVKILEGIVDQVNKTAARLMLADLGKELGFYSFRTNSIDIRFKPY